MEQLEKIIRYLGGDLTGKEKESFETELAIDSSLRASLDLVKEVDKTISDADLVKFVSGIQKAQDAYKRKENFETIKTSTSLKIKRYLSAAAILLVFAISTILYVNFSKPKTDRLYDQFYSKYESSLVTRSEISEINNLIFAIQLYDKGNYKDAIEKFNALLQVDDTNTTAYFFVGLSYMELKIYNKAIQSFNAVIINRDTAFIEHAEWYMSLCYIKTNQLKKATNLLSQVSVSNSFYRVKAVDLLKKLQ